jgi:hypothetical protein
MQVHTFELPSEPGKNHWRFICSDLHVESPQFELPRFKRDMDAAKRVGARILINGDVFDAIPPSDKRWTPSCVRASIRDADDQFDAAVAYVAGILEPYADCIDVCGIGNHERSWIKRHHADPVAGVISRLNATLGTQGSQHRVRHGGVAGYILSKFRFPRSKAGNWGLNHELFYLHGSGGESPVTKGTIDIARKAPNFDCDAITFGHKHNRLFVDDVRICITKSGKMKRREVKALPTGSYVNNWSVTPQDKPLSYNYAEDWGSAPKPMGGMFLVMTPGRDWSIPEPGKEPEKVWTVRQEVMTYPVELPPISASTSRGTELRMDSRAG